MQFLINTLSLSAFYVSFALGLALVFGVMRVINFAHGELFMLGGYTLWIAVQLFGGVLPSAVVFAGSALAAFLLVGMFGLLLQLTLFRALREQPFAILMASLALSYVIQVLVVQTIGPVGRSIPTLFPGIIRTETMIFPYQRLVLVVVSFATIAALWYTLMNTKVGRAVRAVAQNPTGAALQGISIQGVAAITMLIGAGLAALSGVLIGSITSVNPFMGGDAIWRAFIIIIVGGIGSIPGVVLAAFLFGTLDTALAAGGFGQFVALVDALVMLIILAIRPNGLLGAKE